MSIFSESHQAASSQSFEESNDMRIISAVVAGFEYRWYNGVAIPTIKFRDDIGEGGFPILGLHYLSLSHERFCPWCFSESNLSTSLCERCEGSDLARRLSCIHEGPGQPYGDECTPSNPSCGLDSWAKAVCYSKWMLYVASVCGTVKVGISRMCKDGCDMGFTKRLISQGAASWISIGPIKDLRSALAAESKLSDDLSITTYVTTDQKVEWILSGCPSVDIPLGEVRSWIHKENSKAFLQGSFMDSFSFGIGDDSQIRYEREPLSLVGEPVISVGPLVGFKSDDVIVLTSIEKNVGRGLLGDI